MHRTDMIGPPSFASKCFSTSSVRTREIPEVDGFSLLGAASGHDMKKIVEKRGGDARTEGQQACIGGGTGEKNV